jgi:hypothetical protein
MTRPSGGYYAALTGIRRRAQDFAEQRDHIEGERAALEQVFLQEGRPLGDDQYGAELERNLPTIKESILDAFTAYVDELESVRGRLAASADGYQAAEHAGTLPGV